MPDLQPLFGAIQHAVAAFQHAGHVRAYLHVVLAHRLAAQHRVVRQRFFDLHVVEVKPAPNLGDHFIADVAVLVLCVHQHRNQGAALHRIAALQLFKLSR